MSGVRVGSRQWYHFNSLSKNSKNKDSSDPKKFKVDNLHAVSV